MKLSIHQQKALDLIRETGGVAHWENGGYHVYRRNSIVALNKITVDALVRRGLLVLSNPGRSDLKLKEQ